MKRIVRLTENDLTRIVRQVLKESNTTKSLKLKLYSGDGNYITNLDCSNMSLRGKLIDFDWKVAGGGIDYVYTATKSQGYPDKDRGKGFDKPLMIESGVGILECGSTKMRTFSILIEKNTKYPNGKWAQFNGYLSKKGMALVNKTFCDTYASTDTKQDDLDMNDDFA